MFLDEYKYDSRLPDVEGPNGAQLNFEVRAAYLFARDQITSASWHWLKYHFSTYPFHSMAIEIARHCACIESFIPGAGRKLIESIASRKNREKNEDDYQGILQDMSEVLVIMQIVNIPWPEKTAFFYEPAGSNGKRPEVPVNTVGGNYLFEVKAPSLLNHQRDRQRNATQLPTRGLFPLEHIDEFVDQGGLIKPRDNPVKDFLLSADEKFAGFDRSKGGNLLVIVWDDFIYEPISSLVSDVSGLLTVESWLKDENDEAVVFPNIDGVIVVRHLNYFAEALADRPLPDRRDGFDCGQAGALPNVFFPTRWGHKIPSFIPSAFRAVDYRDEDLLKFAEYHPQDRVMWL